MFQVSGMISSWFKKTKALLPTDISATSQAGQGKLTFLLRRRSVPNSTIFSYHQEQATRRFLPRSVIIKVWNMVAHQGSNLKRKCKLDWDYHIICWIFMMWCSLQILLCSQILTSQLNPYNQYNMYVVHFSYTHVLLHKNLHWLLLIAHPEMCEILFYSQP